jgi:hypothetical protein
MHAPELVPPYVVACPETGGGNVQVPTAAEPPEPQAASRATAGMDASARTAPL